MPDSGSVSYNGNYLVNTNNYIAPDSPHSCIWHNIDYITQNVDRPKTITLFDFLFECHGDLAHDPTFVNLILDICLLSSVLSSEMLNEASFSSLSSLSGGEFQRLLIARSLLSRKPILLFDEVTSGLSAPMASTIFNNIKSSLDITLIYTTHQECLLEYSDSIIELTRR